MSLCFILSEKQKDLYSEVSSLISAFEVSIKSHQVVSCVNYTSKDTNQTFVRAPPGEF